MLIESNISLSVINLREGFLMTIMVLVFVFDSEYLLFILFLDEHKTNKRVLVKFSSWLES